MYIKITMKLLIFASLLIFTSLGAFATDSKTKIIGERTRKIVKLSSREGERPKNYFKTPKNDLLLMADPHWGNIVYSINPGGIGDKGEVQTIANTGCGPTSFAMVANYFGVNNTIADNNRDGILTPNEVCEYAIKNNFRTKFDGTDGHLFEDLSKKLNLNVTKINPKDTELLSLLRRKLSSGGIAIGSMHQGNFTKQSHFIVLDGIKNDDVSVRDPNSAEKSKKVWGLNIIKNEADAIWIFTRNS